MSERPTVLSLQLHTGYKALKGADDHLEAVQEQLSVAAELLEAAEPVPAQHDIDRYHTLALQLVLGSSKIR